MIRINLLPVKAAKKREYVKQQLILFAVLVVGTLVGLYMWYDSVEGTIQAKKKEIQKIQAEIKQYEQAIGKVEKYKEMQQKLVQKLKIIDSLVKGKTGPVRVLDKLSQLIPKQVWLIAWEEQGGIVKVTGEALSMEHVGNFMKALATAESELAEQDYGTSVLEKGKKAGDKKKNKKMQRAKRYFTNIKLVSVEKASDKEFNLNYVKFVLNLRVHYDI